MVLSVGSVCFGEVLSSTMAGHAESHRKSERERLTVMKRALARYFATLPPEERSRQLHELFGFMERFAVSASDAPCAPGAAANPPAKSSQSDAPVPWILKRN